MAESAQAPPSGPNRSGTPRQVRALVRRCGMSPLLTGQVLSGRGRASGVIGADLPELRHSTGEELLPGTLNLCLREPVILNHATAVGFDRGLRMLWPGHIGDVSVWIYRWANARLHIIELIAATHLRTVLGVENGDTVIVEIEARHLKPVGLVQSLLWTLAWAGRRDWYYKHDSYQKRLRGLESRCGILQPRA